MIEKVLLDMERIQENRDLGCCQVLFISFCKYLMGVGAGDSDTGKTYILIYVWKQYFQLLN